MNLPPKPKTPVSLSALAARANANKTRSTSPSTPPNTARSASTNSTQSLPAAQEKNAGSNREASRSQSESEFDLAHSDSAHHAPIGKRKTPVVEVAGRDSGLKQQRIRHQAETRSQMLERLTNPLISLHEASVLLRVCTATVRHYSDSGALPHIRTPGGQRRFYLRDTLALLRQQEAHRNKHKS